MVERMKNGPVSFVPGLETKHGTPNYLVALEAAPHVRRYVEQRNALTKHLPPLDTEEIDTFMAKILVQGVIDKARRGESLKEMFMNRRPTSSRGGGGMKDRLEACKSIHVERSTAERNVVKFITETAHDLDPKFEVHSVLYVDVSGKYPVFMGANTYLRQSLNQAAFPRNERLELDGIGFYRMEELIRAYIAS